MTRSLAAAVLTTLLLMPGAAVAAPGDDDVPHTCTNWAWSGPASWTASCGTYGITVLGGKGATLDLGFSSTTCSPGATYEKSAKRHFKDLVASLKSRGWKLDKVSAIGNPQGTSETYRRQTVGFHTTKGTKVQGTATFDYDFQSNVDGVNYCYQRSTARYAKKAAWKGAKGTIARVEKSLVYSGPGTF